MFNWEVCDFDGGDCCTNSSAIVNTMFCEDCFCLQNYPVTDQCYFKAKIGNDICDDLANTEECSYDGGKYQGVQCCGGSQRSIDTMKAYINELILRQFFF